MLIPVILSGGSGTRLWPLSRELYPKQLLPLVSRGTMLQETLARLAGVTDVGAPLVVCNESHRFLVAEQLLERGIQAQATMHLRGSDAGFTAKTRAKMRRAWHGRDAAEVFQAQAFIQVTFHVGQASLNGH